MTAIKVKSIRVEELKSKSETMERIQEEPVVNGGLKGLLELLTKFVIVGGGFAE